MVRFATVDESGAPVCTTYYGSLYRQVDVSGAGGAADLPTPPAATTIGDRPRAEVRIPISAALAHIYTECARIWNPVHTDMAVAAGAGLPGLILHGTATLALAVSAIVQREAAGAPEKVAEIHGRFGAMVLMPSDVVLRILAREQTARGPAVFFEVLSANGGRAIRDGVVILRG
jgi:acyl dehydratase